MLVLNLLTTHSVLPFYAFFCCLALLSNSSPSWTWFWTADQVIAPQNFTLLLLGVSTKNLECTTSFFIWSAHDDLVYLCNSYAKWQLFHNFLLEQEDNSCWVILKDFGISNKCSNYTVIYSNFTRTLNYAKQK